MPTALAAVLEETRQHVFAGRTEELRLFQTILDSAELPCNILAIHGPGGIGKTYLLRQFQRVCDERQISTCYVDGRDIEPAATAFTSALRSKASAFEDKDLLSVLTQGLERSVLFLDTFESLLPLDNWFREEFFPLLSTNTLVVLAGRHALSQSWNADPGYSRLLHVVPLRNLNPSESEWYLARRGVPCERLPTFLGFAHGHPLALSILADSHVQAPEKDFTPSESPDIITPLLQQFIDTVPTPRYREALEACAVLRNIREEILTDLLGGDDVHELFEWLRGCSFMDAGPNGLFPHDLAREVLTADLRWRNPEKYDALLQRTRQHYTRHLLESNPETYDRVLAEYMYTHRHNPVLRPYFTRLESDWRGRNRYRRETLARGDVEEVCAIIRRLEGETSARLFLYWHEHEASETQVFLDADGAVHGVIMVLYLDQIEAGALDKDPGVRSVVDFLAKHSPLRPGERASFFRFWMDSEQHQLVSATQSMIFAFTVRHYLSTPRLAYSFLPCGDPEYWQIALTFADKIRIKEADFVIDGRRFGVFGHDWRTIPPSAWLERIAERAATFDPGGEGKLEPLPDSIMLVLSKAEFGDAVKMALQVFPHLDLLQQNPLLRSRFVLDQLDGEDGLIEKTSALQNLLRREVEDMAASPTGAKLSRALHHAYITPTGSQEHIADTLNLAYSTFRRHLHRGLERLVESLWQREIGG